MTPLVLDSSAAVRYLIGTNSTDHVAPLLERHKVYAPELLIPESLHALRKHVLRDALSDTVASAAAHELSGLPLKLAPMRALAEHAWRLRHNVTPYDAVYIALADMLGTQVLTADARLTRAVPELTALVPD